MSVDLRKACTSKGNSWIKSGSCLSLIMVAAPLLISSGMYAVKMAADRLLLSWYSPISLSAALTAGSTAYLGASVFVGIAGYTAVIVARAIGASRQEEIGSCIWQSLLFSALSGLLILLGALFLSPIFHFIGHNPEMADEEQTFFLIITFGSIFSLCGTSLTCFWTGRKKIWTIALVNILVLFFSVTLSWVLIFGKDGLVLYPGAPKALILLSIPLNKLSSLFDLYPMGVGGAAWGTVMGDALRLVILIALFLGRSNRKLFGTWPKRIRNPKVFKDLVRHGLGNGVHLFFSLSTLAIFNLIVGLYSSMGSFAEVSSSAVAMSLASIALVPLISLGSAVGLFVGHGVGGGNRREVSDTVSGASFLTALYMVLITLASFLFSENIVLMFGNDAAEALSTAQRGYFLIFGLLFTLSEGWGIVLCGAIRGLGDTDYIMKVSTIASVSALMLLVLSFSLGAPVFILWILLALNSSVKAAAFCLRYLKSGRWIKISATEHNN